jgi:hypothetical protein
VSTVTRQAHQHTWRGVIRGQLRQVERRCLSLLKFDSRHASAFVFLSVADQNVVTECANLMEALLGQTGSPIPAGAAADTAGSSPSSSPAAGSPVTDRNMRQSP